MAITERDVVLQGKKDGQTTIDLPVTRLGNIEDTADVKAAPADNDYIPVVDSADNGQMKKTLWSSFKTVLSNLFAPKVHTHDDRYYTESEMNTKLAGKSDTSHTHNYAGSSSAGGAANSANKLNTNAESATQPVYFANGIPVNTTYTLGKSVPSNAVFTDTKYAAVTTSANGLMTAADKTKLNGIAAGATKNVIDTALSTTSTNAVQNKVVTAAINGKAAASHTHDDRYYTESEINTKLAGKSDTSHTHNYAAASHNHDTSNITSGVLSVAHGGTGNVTGYVTVGQKAGTTLGLNATAEGGSVTASGQYSHAEGKDTVASDFYAHAEGCETTASGCASHAEGERTTASGYYSHAEGYNATASGSQSHAEGGVCIASGGHSHAEGWSTVASGEESHAGGQSTIANTKTIVAIGTYNSYDANANKNNIVNYFVIGKGSSDTARSNAFRVYKDGHVYGGTYSSSGADYAEYFEWLDGNPENEDRCGLFVTLDGKKIRAANSEDDFILGIVSGDPSVIGDAHDD